MANVNKLAPKLIKWESTIYTDDPVDMGGATKIGITLSTWRTLGYDKDGDHDVDKDDVRRLDMNDFSFILKVGYWDRWKADSIKNQSIAVILVDWVWASGKWGIVIPQRILGVEPDGNPGVITITALNKADQQSLFNKIWQARLDFINNLVKESIAAFDLRMKNVASGRYPTSGNKQYWLNVLGLYNSNKEQAYLTYTQKRFQKGWLNRLNDFKFSAQ